jgi:cytochrome d ubiquinol oxidase subunit I
MEALIAFFLESTFLGLWIFGWDRLPRTVHLATIWLASLGTVISAYFILAANSWMQHPVGYRINPETGRAELTSIWKVLTNPTQLVTFPHALAASLVTGGAVLVGLSCWHLRRGQQVDLHLRAVRLGLVVCAVASVGVLLSGHFQGQVMTRQQPMKMASAEALWDTERGAGLSLFAYGDVSRGKNKIDIKVPHLLSFMATNSPSGTVQGVNDLQAAQVARYGPGDYTPVMGVTFWNFRAMMGLGTVYLGLALLGLVQLRSGRLLGARRLLLAFVGASVLPYLANTTGWIFTEMGRQPWAVFGLLRTSDAVSPGVSTTAVIATLAGFTVVYGALATVALRLFLQHGRHEIPPLHPDATSSGRPRPGDALPSLAY